MPASHPVIMPIAKIVLNRHAGSERLGGLETKLRVLVPTEKGAA